MTQSGNLFSQSPPLLKNKCVNLHLSSLIHRSNKPWYLFISSFPSNICGVTAGPLLHNENLSKTKQFNPPPALSSFQVNPGCGPSPWHWGLKWQFQSWKQQTQHWDELGAVCNQPQRWSQCTWNGFGAIMESREISKESEAVPEQFPGRKKGRKKTKNNKGKTLGISCLL